MATRYIEAVASDDERKALCPATPGKVGIAYRTDNDTLVITKPDGSAKTFDIDDIVAALTLIDAIPTSDQTDGVTVYSDSGVLKVSTSGG